jgi:glutamine amidotransferase
VIAIVDLGCGNTGSVGQALGNLGAEHVLTSDPEAIRCASRVILPGVGSAGFAMARIEELGLGALLKDLTQPVLGICLGMHLLFERSEEGGAECLGLIPGTVRTLEPAKDCPVPHMGWSKLRVLDPNLGIESGDYVYFAHGYACEPGPRTVATALHAHRIAAAVRHRNWTGVQFHPERSGEAGRRFLENFLA